MENESNEPLMRYPFYIKALEFYDQVMDDTDKPISDERWRVIVRQIVRSAGSISANIEEGYGRGTSQEFAHRLKLRAAKRAKAKADIAALRKFFHQS